MISFPNISILDAYDLLVIFLSLLLTGFAFGIWRKYKKKEIIIETMEFYPPPDFNSLEVAYIYKGVVKKRDVVSLLFYLANKGYLEIKESNAGFRYHKSFEIRKLQEYDGNNTFERNFIKGLFKSKDIVTSNDLKYNFYITVDHLIFRIRNRENKLQIFDQISRKKRNQMLSILLFIGSILLVLAMNETSQGIENFLASILVSGMISSVGLIMANGKRGDLTIKLFLCLFLIFCWRAIITPVLSLDSVFALSYYIGFLCMALIFLMSFGLPIRTDYGNELLGKIRGFRTFLKTAEKDKLDKLVTDNPSYFYHILPYTYVLRVSRKWVHKFEYIAKEAPQWYKGLAMFQMTYFYKSMRATLRRTSHSMKLRKGKKI